LVKEQRIRGWVGEQSFELAEGHEKHIKSFIDAQVFSAAYRLHIERNNSAPDARLSAKLAVQSFREIG
jgi:hypothetical protein